MLLLFVTALPLIEGCEWAIVANATLLSEKQIKQWTAGRKVMALDGAANSFQINHLVPDVILGDFDSVADKEYWGITGTFTEIDISAVSYIGNFGVLIVPALDQDKTDLEKGILYCREKGATSIAIFNAVDRGRRFDHTLGNTGLLRKCYDPRLPMFIYTETEKIEYVKDGTTTIKGKVGDQCAVLGYPEALMSTQGLAYNGQNYPLKLGIQESSCNQLAAPEALIEIFGVRQACLRFLMLLKEL